MGQGQEPAANTSSDAATRDTGTIGTSDTPNPVYEEEDSV